MFGITDLGTLNLSKLIGGHAYTLPSQLNIKGFTFHTHALGDSGANGFLFIDLELASLLVRSCGARTKPLPRPIPITGYDGNSDHNITHYLRLTLQIDNRRFIRMPFCIAPLGKHDIIIGRKWFDYFKVNLAIADRKLLWPASLPSSYFFDKLIEVTRTSMTPQNVNPYHQSDAIRRDNALEKEINTSITPPFTLNPINLSPAGRGIDLTKAKTLPPWKPTLGRHNYADERQRQELNMQAMLKDTFQPSFSSILKNPLFKKPSASLPAPEQNLYEISTVAYDLLSRRKDNNAFAVSLDELDSLIANKQEQDLHVNAELLTLNAAHQSPPSAIDYTPDNHLVENAMDQWPQYSDFKDVFSKEASDQLPPHRPHVDHRIELTQENSLQHSPLYRMTTEELLAVKQYLLENLHKGFITASSSPFASPVLFVKKPDGGLRFCIDYRKLNNLTKKDQHPLPLIDETLARISGAKIFTKLDIRQAFHRIRMSPESEELTTFRTRYGTYKCKVLPFGLTNGPATYQRYMNTVLFDYLDNFCTAYLDDILIYSENIIEHETHVKLVLQRLREAGLQVDIKKTEFHVTRTKYLGFIISTGGLEVDPEKISAIINWQFPHSVRGVQSFLGFCNFYRRFIKDYSRIASPLHELTHKDANFSFSPDCIKAFQQLQELLTTAPLLMHYNPALPTQVETDASDGVIAGVLSQQHPPGIWKPIGYFSKTMSPAELNYQIHDKELLAIVKSFQQWRADLARTNTVVRVWTDHKALEYFMSTKQLNQRQARWAEVLAEFYFSIAYRPGTKNILADTLSRREQDVIPQEALSKSSRTQALLRNNQLDPEIVQQLPEVIAPVNPGLVPPSTPTPSIGGHIPLDLIDRILTLNKESPSLSDDRSKALRGDPGWCTQEGLTIYQGRLIVPEDENLRTQLIRFVHTSIDTAHPGKTKTLQLLAPYYYWKELRSNVATYVANCFACRSATVPRDRTPGFLHPLPIPQRPWQHLTMDYKSFPRDKEGFDMLFVVIDRLSKQSYSIPCHKTITARGMAELFLKYIWCREGYPDSIVSDRGPQFISSFWAEVCRILGIKIKLSTAFHPQTDGQTEIMNQYIDQRLRPFVNHYQDNWSSLIPMMDYAQLSLPHESIGMSPFELLKGYRPRTTWDWSKPPEPPSTAREKLNQEQAIGFAKRMHDAWNTAKSCMAHAQQKKERDINKHRRAIDFEVGEKVWVKTANWKTDRPSKKLSEQMAGPWEILAKEGHSFRLLLPNSMKIHPVFPAANLRRDPDNPLPGQANKSPSPIILAADDEYEVEEVVAVKLSRGTLKYKAKWTGADEDPEFYPASDFKYSPQLLRRFHLTNPERPGPPANLDKWLNAWVDGVDNYDHLDGDKVASTRSRTSFFREGGDVTNQTSHD